MIMVRLVLLSFLLLPLRAEIVWVPFTYGQSLSLGTNGCPALSTAQVGSNQMLTGGYTGTLTPLVAWTNIPNSGWASAIRSTI